MAIEDIVSEVVAAGGLKIYRVRDLRNAIGKTRAKSNVVKEISEKLSELGCEHIPQDIPKDQGAWVTLYAGPARNLVEFITQPDKLGDIVETLGYQGLMIVLQEYTEALRKSLQ